MKIAKITILVTAIFFISACEVRLAPSKFWDNFFEPETDSEYYKEKSEDLMEQIAEDIEEYDINKVIVLDLVDDQDRVPILGEYMGGRVVEEITQKKYFRVAHRGEVKEVLDRLNLKPSFALTKSEVQRLGTALNAQALINGKIRDIGTNIDVHLALVDIATGEVISSATERLNRTRFAVEMLRHY